MSFFALVLVLVGAAAALPATAPRVIIFQLSDDFGWANLGIHGSANYTPNLDSLAREASAIQADLSTPMHATRAPGPPPSPFRASQGIILERHYVFKYCSPSRCALQSGRNPIHVNVLNTPPTQHNAQDLVSGQQGMPVAMTGIAEKLASAGYHTAAYGKWNVGQAHARQTPGGRGYAEAQVYFDYDEVRVIPSLFLRALILSSLQERQKTLLLVRAQLLCL